MAASASGPGPFCTSGGPDPGASFSGPPFPHAVPGVASGQCAAGASAFSLPGLWCGRCHDERPGAFLSGAAAAGGGRAAAGDFALGWRVAQQSAWNPLGFGPGAPVGVAPVPAPGAGAAGTGLVQTGAARLRRAGIMATGLALCLLLLAHHFRPRTFSAYFLDVGQGDCAVVVTPERQVFVFDTGGLSGHFDPGEKILVPFLRYLGTDQVDAVFLSHGHHDHAGGLAGLLRWMPVAAIYLPLENPSKDVEKALHLVQRKNTSKIVYKMQTNQKIGKKKSIIKIVEAPKLEEKGGTGNENSAIVRMSCDGHSFLFTGDAPAEVEELAAQRPIQSDVLKVSHHGSRTSSSEVFLETVRPRLAVISSGRRNSFGHPHRETIEKLETHRIPLVRTDQVGAVKIVFDGATPIWYSYRWQRDSF